MKRKPSVLSLMSVTLLGAVLVASSCKKEAQAPVGGDDRYTSATIINPTNPTLSGVLGTGHNVKDTIRLKSPANGGLAWRLSGLVYVDSADVLIIDAGTTIKGNLSTGTGIPGGGLVVCRGAKILADGTAANPIIFTSANTGTSTAPKSGDWSGVIVLGNASSNHSGRVQVEGVPSNPPASATFGGSTGTVDTDNSGILRHIRIEWAGFELTPNNEINGLTFGGVGSGTTVDFVEVFKSRDDAFEWFGGTVNASHLISVDALDDMFDTDNGFRGTITYALGLADTTRADQSTSNGFESDNDATGSTATPTTNVTYNYITIVGLPSAAKASITNGQPSGSGTYGRSAHLRRRSQFAISNSIFLGYNRGLWREGLGSGTVASSFVHAYTAGEAYVNITPTGSQDYSGQADPNASIVLTNPFDRSAIANFEPDALFSPATAAGAFANGQWATGGFVKLR